MREALSEKDILSIGQEIVAGGREFREMEREEKRERGERERL